MFTWTLRAGRGAGLAHLDCLQVWLMALCVTCVFSVTLSVFPVVTVRVRTVYRDDVAWGQFHS